MVTFKYSMQLGIASAAEVKFRFKFPVIALKNYIDLQQSLKLDLKDNTCGTFEIICVVYERREEYSHSRCSKFHGNHESTGVIVDISASRYSSIKLFVVK